MSKKYIRIGVALAVIAAIFFFGVRAFQKNQQINTIKKRRSELPTFTFQTLESKIFSNQALSKNKPLLLVWFNSTCEHCQYEAEEFYKRRQELLPFQIVMVSDEPLTTLLTFREKYKLDALPNLTIVHDNQREFLHLFGTVSIPSLFIYNERGQLLKTFQGETKIEAIIKNLENGQ